MIRNESYSFNTASVEKTYTPYAGAASKMLRKYGRFIIRRLDLSLLSEFLKTELRC